MTVWRIAIRDDIRAFMVTQPSPYWATTEAERDWYLEKQLKRPRDDYAVVEVPGPVERAIDDERRRWPAVRDRLWEERKQRLDRHQLRDPRPIEGGRRRRLSDPPDEEGHPELTAQDREG